GAPGDKGAFHSFRAGRIDHDDPGAGGVQGKKIPEAVLNPTRPVIDVMQRPGQNDGMLRSGGADIIPHRVARHPPNRIEESLPTQDIRLLPQPLQRCWDVLAQAPEDRKVSRLEDEAPIAALRIQLAGNEMSNLFSQGRYCHLTPCAL